MLKKADFKSGVVKDDTALSAEGSYVDAQWTRFSRGKFEWMGGYEAATSSTYEGLVRGAHSWQDNSGEKALAFGTAAKLYAFYGGEILDITPNKAEGTLDGPFTTDGSTGVVIVDHDQHGLNAGDSITFSHAVAVGGITIDGEYEITEIVTANKYKITHSSNSSSAATGGGYVDFVAAFDVGLVDGTGGAGYGTGAYGEGGYGEPLTGDTFPRTWKLQNWGENLLANPRGGALFEWQTDLNYSDFINSGTGFWTAGTGWTATALGGTKTAGTAANLSQDIEADAVGGKTYRLTFDLTASSGEIQIGINAGLTSPAIVDVGLPCNVTGSYERLITLPAEPLDLVFQGDSSFAGSIDNVTLAVESNAYRIDTAPAHSEGMIVASDRIVILYGSIEADGDFNKLLLRWSDRENNRTWVPSGSNVAGEIQMSIGGAAVAGLASREQNIFWTDSAVYSLVPDINNTYSLVLLGEGPGAIGPLSVASYSGQVFWITKTGVPYTLKSSVSDLAISQPIPVQSAVQDEFINNLSIGQEAKVCCWINPEFTEFWILYPDDRDGLENSRYQAFNWTEPHWTTGTLARTTMLSSGIESFPIGFGADGVIYFHEKGTSANGGTLSAFVETADFDLSDGDNLMHLRGIIPDFKDQRGNINLTIYGRPYANGTRTSSGPYALTTSTQKKDFRVTGRILAMRFEAAGSNIAVRNGSLRFDMQKTGQRR